MNVAVTGGAGFIGSRLVETLVAEGHRVRVIDNFSTGNRNNLLNVIEDIELMEVDIRDVDSVRSAFNGIDAVCHLAAIASVPYSIHNPVEVNDVNVSGTLNTLMAARDAGVSRVVFASSSAVYGNPSIDAWGENSEALMPGTPYAASKLAGESYMKAFCSTYGIETICLRYFNVYGPRQRIEGEAVAAIPSFIRNAVAGLPITITGDGRQTRDFIFVDDVVKANMLALQTERLGGECVDIGSGQSISIAEVVSRVCAIIGVETPIGYASARDGEVRLSQASPDEAWRLLAFRSVVGLDDGLAATANWISHARVASSVRIS